MALIWHGKAVSAKVRTEARKRVLKAAIVVEKMTKSIMKKGGRTKSGVREPGKKLAKIGTFVSKKDEPPRVQFGRLKGSITHEMHPTLPIARVGTNISYALPLELGTWKMKPRPFLKPGLDLSRPFIRQIFGGP